MMCCNVCVGAVAVWHALWLAGQLASTCSAWPGFYCLQPLTHSVRRPCPHSFVIETVGVLKFGGRITAVSNSSRGTPSPGHTTAVCHRLDPLCVRRAVKGTMPEDCSLTEQQGYSITWSHNCSLPLLGPLVRAQGCEGHDAGGLQSHRAAGVLHRLVTQLQFATASTLCVCAGLLRA
eukprot:1160431-Pelagomonas_calceolata.AAC.4